MVSCPASPVTARVGSFLYTHLFVSFSPKSGNSNLKKSSRLLDFLPISKRTPENVPALFLNGSLGGKGRSRLTFPVRTT